MATKTKLTLLFAATSLANASAQENDCFFSNLFLQSGVGYLQETEEPYYYGELGFDICCGGKLFLSYGQFDQTLFDGTVIDDITGKAEETIEVVALGATFGFPVGDNGNFFYGASVGVAMAEVELSLTDGVDSYKFSDDDNIFYADVRMGIEHYFTDHISIVGQVRYIYLDDYEFSSSDLGTTNVSTDDQFAFDLGVKINF